MQKESIPACNSFECQKETAAAPLMQTASIPACNSFECHPKETVAPPGYAQTDSIPACNSFECHPKETAAPPGYVQSNSIPACNSFECQKGTAAAPLMQKESIPACNSFECQKETAAAPLMQTKSIPACNSFECQKETAAAPLMQVQSVPNCTSFECKNKDQSQLIYAQTSSDPICSSAGCVSKQKASHPTDYFVPNFGMDQDIMDSQSHEAKSSEKLGHTWNWSKDPTVEELKDKALLRWGTLVQTEPVATSKPPAATASVAQSKSDPICSSAWGPDCGNLFPTKKGEKVVEYKSFPLEHEIINSQKNLDDTESKLGHKLSFDSKKPTALSQYE